MAKSTATKDLVPFVKNVLFLLLFASSLLTIADGYSCDGCDDDQLCCNGACVYDSSCFGLSCSSISDCSRGESCCHNDCVNGSDCLGESCSSDSDCSFGEGCCSMKCTNGYGCAGLSCSTDSDCGSYENCCGGTCSFGDCTALVVWVVLGSLFGSLFIIFAISLCVHFIYRRRRPAYGRVVEGQRILTAQTTNPPYLGQSPPFYQQGYPYYPPPQYVQYPPHNAGETKASDQPPPYSGAPEGSSGGVHAPQNTYGAVPNPTLPV